MTSVLLFCLLLGVLSGLRSLTPIALVSLVAHLGWLNLAGSPLAFLASPIAVGIFTLLAIGELIGDKTAKIGPRTAPGPFAFRIITGSLCGAALAFATHAGMTIAIIAGAIGAIAGTLAGFRIRRALTAPGKLPDLPVALVEDIIAIGGSLFLVTRF